MTQEELEESHPLHPMLVRMDQRLQHIEEVMKGPPPLLERVWNAERAADTSTRLASAVNENTISSAVTSALEMERARSATAFRGALALAATVAATVATVGHFLAAYLFGGSLP
jgi:hypothetical protein